MISKFFLAALFFAAVAHCFAQNAAPDSDSPDLRSPAVHDTTTPDTGKKADDPADTVPGKPVVPTDPPPDYVRPNAERRFKHYLNTVAGPLALLEYSASAGLLTYRDSPSEWGAKPAGFKRRFANQVGKSLIRNTTIYALDEALKIDSSFRRSRDRSVVARLRNSIFSSVTARNRRGERVFGTSRIAGSVLSEVVSSTAWYPQRFDVYHGLKGGLIAIGVNTGINLIHEFVWK